MKEGTVEARFYCKINGDPSPIVEWYKDNELLVENDKIKFFTEDGKCYLCVRSICTSDEAEYKVLARNSIGCTTSVAELIVTECCLEPEIIVPMNDVEVAT